MSYSPSQLSKPPIDTKDRVRKWFGKRMPVSDIVKLQQKSTYILPTRAGFMLAGIIFIMMVGATNYQNNLAFLLTFLILSLGLVSILFTFRNLQGLEFSRGPTEGGFVGENIQLPVYLASQNKQNHFTVATGFSKTSLSYSDVYQEEENLIFLTLRSSTRGWFEIPRIMATSQFPFGLLNVWTWFKFETPILIFPQPIEPPETGGGSDSDESSGEAINAGNEDLYGLRTYQEGEPISRIDWKTFAKERGVYSKEFVAYQSHSLVFNWDDYPSTDAEKRLSYLCYQVMEASHNNLEYALKLDGQHIEKNSGEQHKLRCLTALALYGIEKQNG